MVHMWYAFNGEVSHYTTPNAPNSHGYKEVFYGLADECRPVVNRGHWEWGVWETMARSEVHSGRCKPTSKATEDQWQNQHISCAQCSETRADLGPVCTVGGMDHILARLLRPINFPLHSDDFLKEKGKGKKKITTQNYCWRIWSLNWLN